MRRVATFLGGPRRRTRRWTRRRLRQVTVDYANSDTRAAARADAALPTVPGGATVRER